MNTPESPVPGVMLRVPNGHIVSVAVSESVARELARSRGFDDTKLEVQHTTLVSLAIGLSLYKPKTKTNALHANQTMQPVPVP